MLTISGESGTGKTTLAEIIAQIYKIPDGNNIKIGQIIRNITQKFQEESAIERPLSVDELVDNAQREIMQKASIENPLVLESRLAGVIASAEKANSPQLSIVSILLTASPDVTVERIKSRRSELSEEEIIRKEKERAQNDLETWKKLHENLDNPYDPKYFNLVIDTDSMSPEDVFIFLHKWLLENDFIFKKENNDTPNTPLE